MNSLDGLNKQQSQAAKTDTGPALIIAGPGTGKTKTLTARIAFLLEKGTPSEKILALTFTNKAAREMRERVKALLGKDVALPHITTFHAFCRQFLEGAHGTNPEIIAESERQQIIRELKKSQKLKDFSIRELSLKISLVKSSSKMQQQESEIANLLHKYQEALSARSVLDFDDLLIQAYKILKNDPNKKPPCQHILIDEFQDTNELQYELIKLLNTTDNLFAIGDPLQSIYGFRGASSKVFDAFRQDWPNVHSLTLPTNYRSVPEVVQVGNSIFPDAPNLTARRQQTGRAQCMQVLNEYSEARFIIDTIEGKIGGSTMIRGHDHHSGEQTAHNFRDFAVLYRTHRTSTALRRLLDESGLPYQVAGEGSPYTHPDITALIDELKKENSSDQPVSQLIARKAENLGFNTASPNLRMLINTAVRFDDAGLPAYLNHLEAIAEHEFYDETADAITLLTIHAAKGLEFNHVFLIGTEEGLLPHHRPKQQFDLDEERRLFYVAITRAKSLLDILHTKKRVGEPSTLSPFVKKLPTDILPRHADPNMTSQQERLQTRALRRSQTSLF